MKTFKTFCQSEKGTEQLPEISKPNLGELINALIEYHEHQLENEYAGYDVNHNVYKHQIHYGHGTTLFQINTYTHGNIEEAQSETFYYTVIEVN